MSLDGDDILLLRLFLKVEYMEVGKWMQIEKEFNGQASQPRSRHWLKNQVKRLSSAPGSGEQTTTTKNNNNNNNNNNNKTIQTHQQSERSVLRPWSTLSPGGFALHVFCDNPACNEHESDQKFKLCGNCRCARYCSTACARNDWTRHKQSCRVADALKPFAMALPWLGSFAVSEVPACSMQFRQQVKISRASTQELVLNRDWHNHRFAGLLQHRNLQVLDIRRVMREAIPTLGVESFLDSRMQWKEFRLSGGLIGRLLENNAGTLKRIILHDVVTSDEQIRGRNDFADRLDSSQDWAFYFRHLYQCSKLESLEFRITPPPEPFVVSPFARMTLSRLVHLEFAAGKTWLCRLDFSGFSESLALAATSATSLRSLFLSWEMPFDDEQYKPRENDWPFWHLWRSTTFPSLQSLKLEGHITYGAECGLIASFINRHEHTLRRLHLELDNSTAMPRVYRQGFTCPETMLPTLRVLPHLEELTVTLPCTFVGNSVFHQRPNDLSHNARNVCLSLRQVTSLLPALVCLTFLVETKYGGDELAAIELARVILECMYPGSDDTTAFCTRLACIYFVRQQRGHGSVKHTGVEHSPSGAMATAFKAYADKRKNALVLSSERCLSRCHMPRCHPFNKQIYGMLRQRIVERFEAPAPSGDSDSDCDREETTINDGMTGTSGWGRL
ncbi:unnamed protein product [Polarella glacialis]|uniref:MYND-type domain-containing protein n=1 Tax=Polarella glacialis TaxID=89957 RepID=A0A813HQK8_POLGL|nr:unnamed protein product [Polarella glacialis]